MKLPTTTKSEVPLFLDIVNVMLTSVREKLPNDALLKSSHNQFKIARRTNPKMIFNNIGTYLLVPFAAAIEEGDFNALLHRIVHSPIYIEHKEEYAEFIGHMVFKPLDHMTREDKDQMIKNLHTLVQLYVSYYSKKGVSLPLNQMVILTSDDMKATRSVVRDIVCDNDRATP